MDDNQFVLDFISQKKLMVIATTNADGNPEDAVVGFGQTDNLEIFFGTHNTTRKYQNLQTNPHVGLVIGWEEGKTVQYQGVARELSAEAAESHTEAYFTKNPLAAKNANHPDQRYFLITPTWIRYTDITQQPWKIIELSY